MMPAMEPREPYEQKFGNFIKLCEEVRKNGVDVVVVANPRVLGDDYDELVESLNRLAEAGLKLVITNTHRASST